MQIQMGVNIFLEGWTGLLLNHYTKSPNNYNTPPLIASNCAAVRECGGSAFFDGDV